VPNARVREFSKEVVEVLFNSTPITNTTNTLAAQVGVCAGHTIMYVQGMPSCFVPVWRALAVQL
jgi:molybdopterin-biosynthesis enzyme MoeA-like protein